MKLLTKEDFREVIKVLTSGFCLDWNIETGELTPAKDVKIEHLNHIVKKEFEMGVLYDYYINVYLKKEENLDN